MPPPTVKTIKDLIFYQYAKLIATSANISGYQFIMSKMKMLSSGDIKMSRHTSRKASYGSRHFVFEPYLPIIQKT